MIVLASLALAASTATTDKAACELPVRFKTYKSLDDVPKIVSDDFRYNAPYVLDTTKPDEEKEFRRQLGRSARITNIRKSKDRVFLSYFSQGGYTNHNVTVGYADLGDKFLFIGAVTGNECQAVKYLIGHMGFRVIDNWRREGGMLQPIKPRY